MESEVAPDEPIAIAMRKPPSCDGNNRIKTSIAR